MKKRAVQQLNAQSLELLEVRTERNELQEYARKQQRKDRLLKLTLIRLQKANSAAEVLAQRLAASEKKHFVELSRMKMRAVQAREAGRKALDIARRATLHLKRLEQISPSMQTIEAPEPKSYGNGDAVTVSVVDQARLDGTAPTVSTVSNRDSARLTKLHSSNEAKAN